MSADAPDDCYTTDCPYCDEIERDCGRHGPSPWIPADKQLPGNPRCVLATNGECHFIAVYADIDADRERMHELLPGWNNAHTDDAIDSVITHWMELPEVPE